MLSSDLQSTIKWMMEPDPQRRPDVSTLLASNRIQKILAQRKALNPFGHVVSNIYFYLLFNIFVYSSVNHKKFALKNNIIKKKKKRISKCDTSNILHKHDTTFFDSLLCYYIFFQKKIHRSIVNSLFNLRTIFYNIFNAIFSVLKLKCAKGGRIIGTADTSTPQSTRFQPLLQTDDSFFRLDDSEIDFEESPNIKNNEKCFYKTPDVLIVNSTPLNHYNQGLRRNRSELSRTSLM